MLRIVAGLDQRRISEWADEELEHLEAAARPFELVMAAGKAEGVDLHLEKSKAEEKMEEKAHRRVKATKELELLLLQTLKEAVDDFGAASDVSDDQLALAGES